MNRRKSILGVLCIAVGCFCAFGVPSSSALSAHECVNGEGIGTGKVFQAGCKKLKAGGGWETVKLTGLKQVHTTLTSPFSLPTTVAGVKFKVECTTLSGEGNIENQEVEGTPRIAGGEIKLEFSGCTVTEPAGKGCKVAEPINSAELKSETSGLKTIYGPASGETFMTMTVSGCSIAALNGEKKVTGKAVGINEEATPETTEFTETSGSELKFAGNAAFPFFTLHTGTKNGAVLSLELP